MAAVTVLSKVRNVAGSRRLYSFKVTVVTTGDTLATGLKQIDSVSCNPQAGITVTSDAAGVITFTGTGANVEVLVSGL